MAIRSLRELFRRLPHDGKTRHLLRNFNLQMTGANTPPSVAELAASLGIPVVMRDMPSWERGRLARDPFEENGFVIEVNQADDIRTRRWTVLHELIHWLLHRRSDLLAEPQFRSGRYHLYDPDETREEVEANEFAEALVFGDGALQAALELFGGEKSAVARHFGVSIHTLDHAIRKLS